MAVTTRKKPAVINKPCEEGKSWGPRRRRIRSIKRIKIEFTGLFFTGWVEQGVHERMSRFYLISQQRMC
jgi:hypothetical protein